jgi:hypothetical protein
MSQTVITAGELIEILLKRVDPDTPVYITDSSYDDQPVVSVYQPRWVQGGAPLILSSYVVPDWPGAEPINVYHPTENKEANP